MGKENGTNRGLSSSGDQPLSLIEFLDLHQTYEDFEAEEGADYVCDRCRHLDTKLGYAIYGKILILIGKDEYIIEGRP